MKRSVSMKILEAIPRINLVKSREPSAQVFPPNFSTRSDTRSDKFYIYMYITKRRSEKKRVFRVSFLGHSVFLGGRASIKDPRRY